MLARLPHFVCLLSLFISGALSAAEVLKLGKKSRFAVISHGEKVRWEKGDNVCFYRGAVEVACGRVVRTVKKAAVMKIITRSESPRVGDEVRRSSPRTWNQIQKQKKKETDLPDIESVEKRNSVREGNNTEQPLYKRKKKNSRFAKLSKRGKKKARYKKRRRKKRRSRRTKASRDIALMNESNNTKAYLYDQLVKQKKFDTIYTADITVGGTLGLNHFYPILNFQFAVGRNISLGLAPFYFAQSQDVASISGFGGHFTFNYYHDYTYRGLWIQAGTGIIKFNAEVPGSSESQTRLSFIGTVGWRQRWDLGINVGAAAGVQFIANQDLQLVDLSYRNIQPYIVIDFGLNF